MPIKYQPVAIPVAKGLDVTTRARLVDPQALLEAENVRFTALGAEKRRGHVAVRVRGSKPLPVGVEPPNYQAPSRTNIPEDWLWGWGHIVSAERADLDTNLGTSPHPDAGVLFGAATRDQEAIFWDGFRFFTRQPNQPVGAAMTELNAVMPHLLASPTSKAPHGQKHPDAADNGRIRVVAWLNTDDGDAWYTVQDSTTQAYLVPPTALGFVDPVNIRVICVGIFIHVLVAEADTDTLYTCAVQEESPREYTRTSLGPCDRFFDAVKISNTEWMLAVNRGDKTVRLSFLDPDGSAHRSGSFDYDYTADATVSLGNVAVALAPQNRDICVVVRYQNGGGTRVKYSTFDSVGNAGHTNSVATNALNGRVAVAAEYIEDSNSSSPIWMAYYDDLIVDAPVVYSRRFTNDGDQPGTQHYWLMLASQAFRVGNRTFVWCSRQSELQSTYFLMDETLRPVGHMDFITADAPSDFSGFPHQCTINWAGDTARKDVFNFHTALGYKVRVPVTTPETGENEARIFTEPSIRFMELDFLPPLYSAQAGRCTYFPGSQVWQYDGVELVEAGFHIAPEVLEEVA